MNRILPLLFCVVYPILLLAQNVDYNMHITRFYGSNCGNDPGFGTTEEHTWKGWTRDNLSPTETYSGCITRNVNGSTSLTGTYAPRSRTNSTATTVYGRIDAWEDDMGNRCDYNTGWNSDDCRANQTCTYNLTNPLEYQWTAATNTCGTGDYNMNVFYQYRYSSTNLPAATEYTATTFSTGGNRPFWGARGSWAAVGSDCAASGTITDGQTSSFRTTVTCKRQVLFRWRVSSEANYDWLEIWVNGTRRNRISGNVNWTPVTINLDFGNNLVEWRYVKDGSVSTGLDRGFVDEIRFVDATSSDLIPGTITGNQTICGGADPSNLPSTSTARTYSTTLNYQWQRSTNNVTWSNISGATSPAYNPPPTTQTYFYRRRVQDGCSFTRYTNTVQVQVNPLPNGNLGLPTAVCTGNSANLIYNATAGTGPFNITYNSTSQNGVNNGNSISVTPSATTTYQITAITDANGCVRTTGFPAGTTVTVNTLSTAPAVATVSGIQCPNTTLNLTANGGTAGTGSNIRWYSGPNGTGTLLGTGGSISVVPNGTTRYYARREGLCNTTNDDNEEVTVRDYAYAPNGVAASVNYCTDDAGWHHFYNASNAIIFSMEGDLSGATAAPVVNITNNGSFYQTTLGAVGACANGWSPGEELFELPRSWNVNFTGTLNPPYRIRYYFPAQEKVDLENAANAHIAANTACGYTYKYPNPNGFYWFKNVGSAYVPPLFDQPTKLNGATTGTINGINYSEIPGITSFSGGSGAIALAPTPTLPVELSYFNAWNNGATNTLQWITQSELNSDRFEIERSPDGYNFERIGTVQGAGTTTQELTYLWEDKAPLLGVNYYRLRQIDTDGTTNLSNVVAVVVNRKAGTAQLFPNPTSDRLTYQLNAAQAEILTIRLTNVLGEVVQKWTFNTQVGINTQVLDLERFAAGTYLVTIYNQAGDLIQTERVIKQVP